MNEGRGIQDIYIAGNGPKSSDCTYHRFSGEPLGRKIPEQDPHTALYLDSRLSGYLLSCPGCTGISYQSLTVARQLSGCEFTNNSFLGVRYVFVRSGSGTNIYSYRTLTTYFVGVAK